MSASPSANAETADERPAAAAFFSSNELVTAVYNILSDADRANLYTANKHIWWIIAARSYAHIHSYRPSSAISSWIPERLLYRPLVRTVRIDETSNFEIEHVLAAKRTLPGLQRFEHCAVKTRLAGNQNIVTFPSDSSLPLQWERSTVIHTLFDISSEQEAHYVRAEISQRYHFDDGELGAPDSNSLYDSEKYHSKIDAFSFGSSILDLERWTETYAARVRSEAVRAKSLSFLHQQECSMDTLLRLLETIVRYMHLAPGQIAYAIRRHCSHLRTLYLQVVLGLPGMIAWPTFDLASMTPLRPSTLRTFTLHMTPSPAAYDEDDDQDSCGDSPFYDLAHCLAWLSGPNTVLMPLESPYSEDLQRLVKYLHSQPLNFLLHLANLPVSCRANVSRLYDLVNTATKFYHPEIPSGMIETTLAEFNTWLAVENSSDYHEAYITPPPLPEDHPDADEQREHVQTTLKARTVDARRGFEHAFRRLMETLAGPGYDVYGDGAVQSLTDELERQYSVYEDWY